MTCREAEGLLGAYLDEELDLVHSLDVEAHARECASCGAALRRWDALRAAVVSQAPYYAAPPELRAGIERRAAEHFGIAERQDLSSWRSWRWFALAAACAGIALIVWRVAPSPLHPAFPELAREVVDGHVRSLLAAHLTDVVSSDRHTVKPWFAGKLDFAPDVRDLSASGFTLEGGRLDYLHSRTVAALVYRRRQHTVNLYLWPAHEPDRPPRSQSLDGYHVVSWIRGGMNWWAVSDLNAAELEELPKLL